MQSQYGDTNARNAVFAESATQLHLEAAARKNDSAARPAAVLPIVQVSLNYAAKHCCSYWLRVALKPYLVVQAPHGCVL